jgi:hypothetical protein
MKPMKTYLINGRLMQQQPCQQQQGGGGKGGGAPAPAPPAPPPPPPVSEDPQGQAQDAERDLQNRRGAVASNVTGPLGAPTPATATKTLHGA